MNTGRDGNGGTESLYIKNKLVKDGVLVLCTRWRDDCTPVQQLGFGMCYKDPTSKSQKEEKRKASGEGGMESVEIGQREGGRERGGEEGRGRERVGGGGGRQ